MQQPTTARQQSIERLVVPLYIRRDQLVITWAIAT
jgi:hypothetical protein